MEAGLPDSFGRIKPFGDDYFGTAGEEMVSQMDALNIEKNLK